jgi:hypothetical protein
MAMVAARSAVSRTPARSAAARFLAAMTTWAPRAARTRAVSAPIPLDAPGVRTNQIEMRGSGKGKGREGFSGKGALPVTMAVRPAAERPWVTWSAVETQEKPEAPFRLKIDGSIVASGVSVVDHRRMN